jgi:predicted nucleotidyltransferase
MFEEIIVKVGSALNKHGLPYMIIGGQAVLLYGEPRLTRDIDITLGVDIDHLDELLKAIKEIPLKQLVDDVSGFVEKTMVFPAMHEPTSVRVDFIFSFTPYEADAIKRAKRVKILDVEIAFAAIEDLIIHKVFAGRPRDIEDVRLLLLKNRNIDVIYIEKWLREMDTATDKNLFLATFRQFIES